MNPAIPAPGDLVGPWRLGSEAGRGGVGIVFLAHHVDDGRAAAIKFLKSGLASPERIAGFTAERDALARLDHPGIARFYGSGTDGKGRPWIAMEWVDGLPFPEYCDQEGLNSDRRIKLLATVCRSLHHTYQKGLVHGDIRAPNVLVADGRTKIVDFGLAGDRDHHDVRIDVLGLGEILAQTVSLETVLPGRRSDFKHVVAKATKSVADQRYPTPGALADDLDRLLADEPVSARVPDLTYVVSRLMRRRKAEVSAAAAVLVAALIGLGSSTAKWIEARSAQATAEQRLQEVLLLSDIARLNQTREAAAALPAPEPGAGGTYEQWLAQAEDVLARLPSHRASLEQARTQTEVDARDRWRVETLATLVGELEEFGDDDPAIGLRSWVQARRARLTLAEEMLAGPDGAEAWRVATQDISTAAVYGGLDLRPQPGLVPLGPNPVTGLWAFWHIGTGDRPAVDPDRPGGFRIEEDDGLVLVLLPGGAPLRGAQSFDPNAPHYDPAAQADESPVQRIPLEPFFVSMYEVTRGQWVRTQASDPEPSAEADQATRPVVLVSWEEAATGLSNLGLALPTEAQWEYAARGGTVTPWWTGADTTDLRRRTNTGTGRWSHVGRQSEPNGFGLYDVTGNAWEWTADVYGGYDRGSVIQPSAGAHPGTGRARVLDLGQRTIRGGGNSGYAQLNRVANRSAGLMVERPGVVGFRPVRSLRPRAAGVVAGGAPADAN